VFCLKTSLKLHWLCNFEWKDDNYLSTWRRVFFEKQISNQLDTKFLTLRRIRRFITVLKRSCHWPLYWARWIQSTSSQPISLIPILILSFHLRQDLSSVLLPSGFPTEFLYTRVYPKVSGLAAWGENCRWYSFLPLCAVVPLFCESA
jgi:hypothetical protein